MEIVIIFGAAVVGALIAYGRKRSAVPVRVRRKK